MQDNLRCEEASCPLPAATASDLSRKAGRGRMNRHSQFVAELAESFGFLRSGTRREFRRFCVAELAESFGVSALSTKILASSATRLSEIVDRTNKKRATMLAARIDCLDC